MSTEDFNKKINESTKAVAALRKDINYRQQQADRGQTTYSIDAEIRGQLTELESVLSDLQRMVKSYDANPKDFNINAKQLQRRKGQFQRLVGDKTSLKRTYDSFFQKKASQDIAAMTGQQTFKQKHNTTNMTPKQLAQLKKKQQQDQQSALDDLIDTVRNIKDGNKGLGKELTEQKVLINELEDGIDDSSQRMSKTQRKMKKLLDKSSTCCLISTIVVEIAAIVCILLFM